LRYDANAFGLPAKTYTGRTKQRYLSSVNANEIGMVNGRHHSAWHDEAKRLRREGRDIDAEQLLLTIVDATEAESRTDGIGVAPSAYEQLAILYRKRKDFDAECAILERFAQQSHAPGVLPGKLRERYVKACQLRDKHRYR
jgi:hypothetical protein